MTNSRPPRLRVVVGGGGSELRPHDEYAALAGSAVQGNAAAVSTLVRLCVPHILRVVRKVLGPEHPDVDDIVQDCAFGVIEALQKWRGESSVLYFVCRIAALTAMKVRRRDATQKRSRTRDDLMGIEGLPSASPAPDDLVLAQVNANLVRELLDTLPVEQSEVLVMHCVLGFTVQEMAQCADLPVETVRSRMRLAKEALRRRFRDDPRIVELVEESS